jgi:hypothetical protein
MHPRVLIAAPIRVVSELGSVLEGEAALVGGERSRKFQHQIRPFRILNYVREELRGAHIPTMLVRALPVPIGETEEARIRESYTTLRVDALFNLHDEARRTDRRAALHKFRDAIQRLLPMTGERRRATAKRTDTGLNVSTERDARQITVPDHNPTKWPPPKPAC